MHNNNVNTNIYGIGPTGKETIDAEAWASALIEQMEMKLSQSNQLDQYDVYCQWYEDSQTEIEVWLRDRADDSRIGPLDYKRMIEH